MPLTDLGLDHRLRAGPIIQSMFPRPHMAIALGVAVTAGVVGLSARAKALNQAGAITGSVIREDGSPVRGATVMVAHNSWDVAERQSIASYRTTTDERGQFTLPFPVELAKYGTIWVTAFADGLAAASDWATSDKQELRLVLRAETRLPVRIVDESGAGLAGVHLFLWQGSVPMLLRRKGARPRSDVVAFDEGVSSLLAPPSDAQGRVEVHHLPRGGVVSIVVGDPHWVQVPRAADFARDRVTLAAGPLSAPQTILVRPAASVEGRVVTESGRPVAGYEVHFQSQVDSTGGTATTDRSGGFRIDGLSGGDFWVVVGESPNRMPGRPPRTDFVLPERLTLPLQPEEHRRGYQIVCPRGSLVTGRILDAATARPVPKVSITVGRPGDDLYYGVGITDVKGMFRGRVGPGDWAIVFDAPTGYDDFYRMPPVGYRGYPQVRAENGKDYNLGDLRLVLQRARTVRGKVLNPDGTPAARANVYYFQEGWEPSPASWMQHVSVDARGNFTITNLPRRGVCFLRARKDALSTAVDIPVGLAQPPGLQTLKLQRRPQATIRGRVVDDHGRPVPDAIVDVAFPARKKEPPAAPYSDADGRFSIEVWPDEEYTVYVASEDFGLGQSDPVRPDPGARVEVPSIVLHGAESDLQVLFLRRDSRPVGNARVEIELPPGSPRIFNPLRRTDSKGRLRLCGVLPGRYRVLIFTVEGAPPTEAWVEAGQYQVVNLP